MSPVSPASVSYARWLVALCVASLAVIMIAPAAVADQDEGDRFEGRRGTVGLAYVYGESDFDHEPGSGTHIDQADGGTFWMTYRFNQWIASQVRGTYLNGFEIRFNGNDRGTQIGQATLGARLFPLAPLTAAIDDRVEPFLDVSLGLSHVDRQLGGSSKRKKWGVVSRFGGGADFWITDAIGIELSGFYNLAIGQIVDYSNYGGTAGLTTRF